MSQKGISSLIAAFPGKYWKLAIDFHVNLQKTGGERRHGLSHFIGLRENFPSVIYVPWI